MRWLGYLRRVLIVGGYPGRVQRGKGLGTRMIALALGKCRELGIGRVLMCCDSDNFASARTIEKNGGVLENVVDDGGAPVKRYWITLK